MAKKGLFRKKALERLESPEQLDRLIHVTSSRGWLGAIGASLIVIIAILWAIFGRMQSSQTIPGILLRQGGVAVVQTVAEGQVVSLDVAPGEMVETDQTVARVLTRTSIGRDVEIEIKSTHAGRVLDVAVRPGDIVRSGSTVLRVESAEAGFLAIGYLPLASAQQVSPGMPVQISPVWARPEEYGFLVGSVESVARFPATREGMMHQLGDEDLVASFTGLGPVSEVVVHLQTDISTTSGYNWSNPAGGELELFSGTPCQLTVVTGEERPIATIFPMLR